MYLTDYHIHPNYSIDAAEQDDVHAYCRKAIEIGLKEICFTTHFECDPVRAHLDSYVRCKGKLAPMDGDWLESYFDEIWQANKEYSPLGLKVKAGLEVGYDLGLEEKIARVLQYPFDFVIGSVHCVDHWAISSERESSSYFPGKRIEDIVSKYFSTLLQGVKTGFFDVIGHVDLYRRHGMRFFGPVVEQAHRGLIEEVLKEMVINHIGLEINTSSIKHGHKEFYPAREIIEMAKKTGITVFTTGSDSHRVTELGRGIKEAGLLLEGLGLAVTTFTKRQPDTALKNV